MFNMKKIKFFNFHYILLMILIQEISNIKGQTQSTGLQTQETRSTTITITWNIQLGMTYKMKTVAKGSTNTDVSGSTNVDAPPFVITHISDGSILQPRTEYDISVYAVNQNNYAVSRPARLISIGTGPSPPFNVQTSSTNPTELVVTWDDDDTSSAHPVDQYKVTYRVTSGGGEIVTRTVQQSSPPTTLTITGLTANTDYTIVSVISLTTSPIKFSDDSASTNGATIPSRVNPPRSTSSTTSSISLEWDSVSGSVSVTYTVTWSPSSFGGSKTGITTTSTAVNYLNANTQYNFKVQAVNKAGTGQISNGANFVTLPNAPGTPTLNKGSDDPTTTIEVDWNKPSGTVTLQYIVDWTSASDSDKSNLIRGTTYTINNLTPGEIYAVSVKAQNTAGPGSPSSTADHRTVPDSVKNLKVSQNSQNPSLQLDLRWESPQGVGDSISITYISSDGVSDNNKVDFSTRSATIDVQPGTNYTVTTTNVKGSLSSEQATQQINSKPSQPMYEVTSGIHELNLTWTKLYENADTINIEVDGNGFQLITLSPTETTYIVTNLTANTEYTIKMYSTVTNIHGNTEQSTSSSTTHVTVVESANNGLIVGIVVAVVIVIILVGVGGVYYYRRRTNNKNEPPVSMDEVTSSRGNVPPPVMNETDPKNIPLTQFQNFMKETPEIKLIQEFQNLSSAGIEAPITVAKQPENLSKNRYGDILPYDKNRVILPTIFGSDGSDYINASYIRDLTSNKLYIATQGPLQNTMIDFWRMIWEQKSYHLVLLSNLVEDGEVKCECYWPTNKKPVTKDNITVQLILENTNENWTIRKFKLKRDGQERTITQFHATFWENNNFTGDRMKLLVRFVTLVKERISKSRKTGPIVVHCSNGSGRSGTFIAMDYLIQRMQETNFINIYDLVKKLRENRQMMVENQDQYLMLYKMVECVLSQMYEEVVPNHDYVNARITTGHPIYETIEEENYIEIEE